MWLFWHPDIFGHIKKQTHCCSIWSSGDKNEKNFGDTFSACFVIIFDWVFFFFFFSDASDQKQSREKQESNLCILWSCFPTFHAALTVCHKWSHLLQSVTSNASVGVQMWSIRAARCRTERQRRRATAISTEHQRINWTILQFVSLLRHLVLFCARQQSHLVLGKVVQSALPLDDSFYARMSKDFTPKTQLTQRVSDEWNEEYYDVSHDENPFVLLGVQVLSPDVSQKFLVVIPSGVRV